MITVMSSDVSADLKFAKVYYSVYGECDDKELRKGLKSATPFIRSRLAERLNLRITPEITFVKEGVKHGAEIAAILKQIQPTSDANDEDAEEEDE